MSKLDVYNAFVSLDFFSKLLPFNAEVRDGNAMVIRACGAQPKDGSILRSSDHILFGNGLLTIVFEVDRVSQGGSYGYWMRFTRKKRREGDRGTCWEAQTYDGLPNPKPEWKLSVSSVKLDSDDGIHIVELASQNGKPGQYIFLFCDA